MNLSAIRLPGRPDDWDTLIQRYEAKTVFHESGWLDHVATIFPGSTIEYVSFQQGGERVGLFCGVAIRKFFVRILGSPLPGTGTFFMGPLHEPSVDTASVVRALVGFCRKGGFQHLELTGERLDPEALRALGFQAESAVTRLCRLAADEAAAWASLRSTCRNRIRKAEQNGLVAEVTDDPAIVDHFFTQSVEVFGKQGLSVPFTIDRPRSLYAQLMPRGRLIPVWVKHRDQIVATGLFPHDERCVHFWGGASWLEHQHLHPNELLHWTLMREAIRRGVPLYNMYGSKSQFKEKFGGEEVEIFRFSWSSIPMLNTARNLYWELHQRRRKGKGRKDTMPRHRDPVAAESSRAGD